MIEITYRHIEDTGLDSTMKRLCADPTLPHTVSSHLRHYNKFLKPAVKAAKDHFFSILADYAERDENGKFKAEGKSPVIKAGSESAYKEAFDQMMETRVKVLYMTLPAETLKTVKLSANDKDALEPFVDNIDSI